MNSNYTIIAQVSTGKSAPPIVFHDFKILNEGESAIFVSYETLPRNLRVYNITTGQSWVVQGVFQGIDIETGKILFEWHSLDHVDVAKSYVRPNTTDVAGDGLMLKTG